MNIKQLKISDLRPHAHNPRLFLREEVISGISSNLATNGFKEKYAIIVRPVDDYFEIISGHHRVEAAKRSGLTKIPCWIEEMDDETAYMELVTSNSQGELSSMEIGIHALSVVEKARGKSGYGLKAYASSIGWDEKKLQRSTWAAEVYLKLKTLELKTSTSLLSMSLLYILEDGNKNTHLEEIRKAPELAWPVLVNLLDDESNTVGKIKNHVKLIKQIIEAIPDFMMPKEEKLKESFITSLCEIAIRSPAEASKRISVFGEIKRLGDTLGVVTSVEYVDTGKIEQLDDGLDYHVMAARTIEVDLLMRFVNEIEALTTIPKIEKVQAIYQQIKAGVRLDKGEQFIYERVLSDEELYEKIALEKQEILHALKAQVAGKIVNEDCVDVLSSWQGKKISLLLTDPPYGMAYQSNRRIASDKLPEITNDNSLSSALDIFGSALDAMSPHFSDDVHLIVFCNDNYESNFKALIESKGFTFKRLLVWVKPNHGTGDLEGSFAPRKELMIHAVKGRPLVSPRIDDVFIQESKESETDHPAEKPLSILKKIILSTTDEGDLVIDPFAGTGSTLVAALELNRDCWGSEIEDHYFLKAQERLIATVVDD